MASSTARVVLIATVLVAAGCQGLYGSAGPTSDPQAVDALRQAREASHNVASYRYAVDGQVRIRQDSRSRSIDISAQGFVDVDRRRANLTVHTRGDTEVGQRETRIAHLDGYAFALSCPRVGWARHDLSQSTDWFNYTSLGQQLALLDRTTLYWNGTEVVDGVEAAVVTARPAERHLQPTHPLPPGGAVTRGGASLENATVRAWIDTDTGRLLEVRREIHVRGGGSTGVATLTYHFSGYVEPTDVTRPSFQRFGPQLEGDCVDP